MKNKTIISIAVATMISCPALADIAANAPSAKCDNGTLETYEGSSNLKAQWDPNTINLKWYNGEQEIQLSNDSASKTCEYDSGITLPTQPTKTGYEFSGWKVRSCLAGIDPELGALQGAENIRCKLFTGQGLGIVIQNGTAAEAVENIGVSDLNNGEWAVNFSYGTVYGTSTCVSTAPKKRLETADADAIEDSQYDARELYGVNQYCWCKTKSFSSANGGNKCFTTSSPWLGIYNFRQSSTCADYCIQMCATAVGASATNNPSVRSAIFGLN